MQDSPLSQLYPSQPEGHTLPQFLPPNPLLHVQVYSENSSVQFREFEGWHGLL